MFYDKSVSAYYKLSWNEENNSFVLSIHEDYIKENASGICLSARASMIEGIAKSFNLNEFVYKPDTEIGYSGVLKLKSKSDQFFNYEVSIPSLYKEIGECRYCESRMLNDPDSDCLFCDNTRVESKIDQTILYPINASLVVIFSYLHHYDEYAHSCDDLQLISFDLGMIQESFYGFPISGFFHKDLVAWVSKSPCESGFAEVNDAMHGVYSHMTNLREKFYGYHSTFREDGSIHLSCPGDACGIDPEHNKLSHLKGELVGYRFVPHNTDNAIQQLTILAGLAKLEDMARENL